MSCPRHSELCTCSTFMIAFNFFYSLLINFYRYITILLFSPHSAIILFIFLLFRITTLLLCFLTLYLYASHIIKPNSSQKYMSFLCPLNVSFLLLFTFIFDFFCFFMLSFKCLDLTFTTYYNKQLP